MGTCIRRETGIENHQEDKLDHLAIVENIVNKIKFTSYIRAG